MSDLIRMNPEGRCYMCGGKFTHPWTLLGTGTIYEFDARRCADQFCEEFYDTDDASSRMVQP